MIQTRIFFFIFHYNASNTSAEHFYDCTTKKKKKRKKLPTLWVTVDKLHFRQLSIPECARLFDESRRRERGWGSTVSRFEKTFIRQNCATTLGNAIDFFVSPRFPPLRAVLACWRSRARRGAARKEDRICEMAVHEGWISDEVIRGGWSGPPCRRRGKSCKGEKFEVNSIEIGGSTIYFVTGLTSCHPFPLDSMHVRNDSPRCARVFQRETTGWVVFTYGYYDEKFRTFFSFFFFW